MAPERWPARALRALALVVFAAFVAAPAAQALRIVDYNVLNYPGTTGSARDPSFRTIIQLVAPDLIVAEEMTSQAGTTEFLNSLNVMEPGQWAALPFIDGGDTDCAFFYKPSKFAIPTQSYFYPDPTTNLRLVHVYRVRPLGYTSNDALISFYSLHLKASKGTACTPINCETRRLNECIGLRDSMNAMPAGSHAFALGDYNFYTGTEPGLSKLLESQSNNTGRLYDPLGLQGINWQDNGSIALYHTQSPCKDGTCANGAANGGLDDRFDLILPTLNWNDGQGYEIIPGSYRTVGNDGLHLNGNITDAPTIPEGSDYAIALKAVSDHLPVRVDIQVPAKISLPASIAFGSVLVGATATQNLSVSNPAVPPADVLDYSLSPDAGFSAPGGPLTLAAGAPPANHTIGMETATPGVRDGFLFVSADDPDNPFSLLPLSGTVLDHAQASLDSTSALLAQPLDFGVHAGGTFSTLMARVHDRGYTSLRARLSVNSGAIVGGDGRFSIVGGFSPALVSGVARAYTVQFNDAGATPDLDYDATLTFASADEPLPGATAQPALTVSLHAKVTGSAVGVPGGTILPTTTRLYPPTPNPTAQGARVHFDLAREGDLRLDVFDLAGRRVATLASGAFAPGQYDFPWDGRAEGGATLGSGLYFVRLSIAGSPTRIARLVVLR